MLKSEQNLQYMGLLNKLFGASTGSATKKEKQNLSWIPLDNIKRLKDIVGKSKIKPQVIFKHSTRCGVSRMLMNQFIDAYDFNKEDVDLYYLDLLSHRDISNEVAQQFQVVHQSPQLIIVKDGDLVAHASHGQILEVDLRGLI